jgi:ribonuclease HII
LISPPFEEIMLSFERHYAAQGCSRIAGIDEAGRGPLAGPVVAAVCILPPDTIFQGLNDSKQLSESERERLYAEITEQAEYGVGIADSLEVDRFNVLKATFLAMSRALAKLEKKPDLILVDGHLAPSFGILTVPLVGGDGRSASIAAASVLAKVTRDRMMIKLHDQFPQYGFAGHKGYGTPEHLAAINKFGPCAVHRKTFAPIKDAFNDQLDLW